MRVEATFSDNLNKVPNSKIEGNADNSKGRCTYILAKRTIKDNVMLKDKSKSSSIVGSGIIIKTRMPTTAKAMMTSLFLVIYGSCPVIWV